jgi:hypothetical protein
MDQYYNMAHGNQASISVQQLRIMTTYKEARPIYSKLLGLYQYMCFKIRKFFQRKAEANRSTL